MMYHDNPRRSTPDNRPFRYQVFAVADAECSHVSGEAIRSFQDLGQAKHFAGMVARPFGAAIVDRETGAIDFGHGFGVEIETPDEVIGMPAPRFYIEVQLLGYALPPRATRQGKTQA